MGIQGVWNLFNEIATSPCPLGDSRAGITEHEQLNELEPMVAFFASLVLEILLVQPLSRSDMTVLLSTAIHPPPLVGGDEWRTRYLTQTIIVILL